MQNKKHKMFLRKIFFKPMVLSAVFLLAIYSFSILNIAKAATDASLSLTPTPQSTTVGGSNVSYVANIDPGSNSVNAVQVDLVFDRNVVQLVSVSAVAPFFSVAALMGTLDADIATANSTGIFHNAAFMASGAGVASSHGVATLVFSPQGAGNNSTIDFDTDSDAMNNGVTVMTPTGNRTGATVTVAAPDSIAPTTPIFTLPARSNSLTIPITSLTSDDATGVTAWMVKETTSNSAPAGPVSGDGGWVSITSTPSANITGNIIASGEGNKYFWAYTKDAAGNVSAASVGRLVSVDLTAPTVSITSPANGSIISNAGPVLTYTVSDGTIVMRQSDGAIVNDPYIPYDVNNPASWKNFGNILWKSTGPNVPFASGDNLPGMADGVHGIRIEATDAAGNTSITISNFTVDVAAPTFTELDGVSSSMVERDTIKYTITDLTATTQFYGFSSDAICNASDTITTPFTSGADFFITTAHTDYLCLKAIDGANNVSYHTVGQLNVNPAPVISAISPTGSLAAGTTQTTVTFTTNESAICKYSTTLGTSFDSMANVIDTVSATSHSFVATGLANGVNYSYFVRCQDDAGMKNSADQLISFSVANPAPVVVVSDDSGHSDKKKETPSRSITNSKKTVTNGQILTQRGKKFSKNSFVMLYFGKPGGGFYAPQKVKTSASGAFTVTYKVNKPKGKYGWYVFDTAKNKKSKTVYYTVK